MQEVLKTIDAVFQESLEIIVEIEQPKTVATSMIIFIKVVNYYMKDLDVFVENTSVLVGRLVIHCCVLYCRTPSVVKIDKRSKCV